MWATLAAFHNHEISSHSEHISKLKPYGNRYDWSRISFPTDPRDIRIWEANNHIRVNVLGWDGSFYIVKNNGDSYERTVNLLLISDLSQSHHVMITDLDKLLSSEVNSDDHHKHHSSNCLRMFYSESSRDKHHARVSIVIESYQDHRQIDKPLEIELRFIDSLRFMGSSLSSLVPNLIGVSFDHIDEDYIAHGSLSTYFLRDDMHCKFHTLLHDHTDVQFRLLLRKGIYQYEYMDD